MVVLDVEDSFENEDVETIEILDIENIDEETMESVKDEDIEILDLESEIEFMMNN